MSNFRPIDREPSIRALFPRNRVRIITRSDLAGENIVGMTGGPNIQKANFQG